MFGKPDQSWGFDSVENSRASLLADLDRAMGEAQLRRKDREAGQVNLFDMMGGWMIVVETRGKWRIFSMC